MVVNARAINMETTNQHLRIVFQPQLFHIQKGRPSSWTLSTSGLLLRWLTRSTTSPYEHILISSISSEIDRITAVQKPSWPFGGAIMDFRPTDRLTRNSSTSSYHMRERISIDPFVSRYHAETAAAQAYSRSTHQTQILGNPCPVRRRSKREGSHFENARMGGRSPGKKFAIKTKPSRNRLQKRHAPSMPQLRDQPSNSFLALRVTESSPSNQLCSPFTVPSPRRVRKVISMTGEDGSPAPRHKDGYGGNLAVLSDFSNKLDHQKISSRTQVGWEVSHHLEPPAGDPVAIARDRELQNFQHQSKLRGRKSNIFAPFQKRSFTALIRRDHNTYGDNSIPPFNLADVDPPPATPTEPRLEGPVLSTKPALRPRNFSDTLKERFKRAFRKTPQSFSGLPPQHIEAKNHHFLLSSYDESLPRINARSPYPPLPLPQAPPRSQRSPDPYKLTDHSASKASIGNASLARSRVTSWADTSVAETLSTRKPSAPTNNMHDYVGLQRSDSVSTLKRTGSFISRNVGGPIRRASKRALRSSDESQGLYHALRDHMKPKADENIVTMASSVDEIGASLRDTIGKNSVEGKDNSGHATKSDRPLTSALASLPSQKRKSSTAILNRFGKPAMLRDISASSNAEMPDLLSPVVELNSPPLTHMQMNGKIDERVVPHTIIPTPNFEFSDKQEHVILPRSRVLSPSSIYSRLEDGSSTRPATPVDPGAMITITGREVRRYSISPAKENDKQPLQHSGEWRRWISNEMQKFNLRESTGQDDCAALGPRFDTTASRSQSPACRPASRETSMHQDRSNSRAGTGRASFMNERYPMLLSLDGTGLQSRAPSRSSNVDVPVESPSLPTNATAKAPDITVGDNNDSVIEAYSRLSTSSRANSRVNKTRPHSALDLKARYRYEGDGGSRPLAITKQRSHNILEDSTIRKISEGPYARSSSSASQLVDRNSITNRENTKPINVANMANDSKIQRGYVGRTSPLKSLPSLSSAEWLATGVRRATVKGMPIQPAARNASNTPQAMGRTSQAGKGEDRLLTESPAQKMVTEWLDSKRSKGNSPAFV